MELIIHHFNLKLKHRFTISRYSRDTQQSVVIELREGEYSGFGEATSNPYYGTSTQKIAEDIKYKEEIITSLALENPDSFWQKMYPHFKDNMFALCALDVAFNDLFTKKRKLKLYEYWNLQPYKNPKTNYTIAIDSIDKMISKLKELPWPIYKIKLGTANDIEIIKELRKHTNAVFRVDANCGWSVEETIKNSFALKEMGVEFIEQPLKADNWLGHKEVFSKSVLPIIADESCLVEEDVERCHRHFHGVNVKLMKCGGVTPAKRMLEKAKVLGMKTMVGCMTESSVGIAAIAHLLPLLNYVDMDGALLLSEDIAKGVSIKNGTITYSALNGTGAQLI